MGRLLNEDDVIDVINKRINVLQKHPEFRRKNADIDLYGIKPMIAELPSAEPERKKGKWIHDNPNTFRCSRCNKYLDISCGNMKMNFCPNCGADMRGEQE